MRIAIPVLFAIGGLATVVFGLRLLFNIGGAADSHAAMARARSERIYRRLTGSNSLTMPSVTHQGLTTTNFRFRGAAFTVAGLVMLTASTFLLLLRL
ncbi:hypothetical protein B7P34_23985 [Streptosporangium nondiastaticum]|uniref:Uncharacterized protein n=1 Tax=Streptosporangium nondiastaticum TaxID=35764 RepID=A0A9X7JM28_9ACTN|nr:hypothetical protein [Streptosporangium nondiastaticum]PSJ26205.1 hypothetical protein B7P34_23985 [Streptosporangium nondiastaticum]